ncbi:MAG: response regulator [Planctomycetia bacterium]|nr:response regulator [Planctomycetia bacterium]
MNKDPYQYFRIEARELLEGLSQGVLHLERYGASPEQTVRLLRLAHTLKGAARVVRQNAISECAHAIEDELAPFRAGDAPLEREPIQRLLKLVDEIGGLIGQLDPAPKAEAAVSGPAPAGARPPAEEPLDSVRLPIGELDVLHATAAEAGIKLRSLRRASVALASAVRLAGTLAGRLAVRPNESQAAIDDGAGGLAEELRDSLHRLQRETVGGLESAERELGNVSEKIGEARLLPASMLFTTLERATRDAADALGKQVTFECVGADQRLDAHVLRALRDALLHLVRNAVAHGIETAAERRAGRKPEAGRVRLVVSRQGPRAVVRCEDDGRGIDLSAVRRAAVQRGLVSERAAADLSMDDAVRLLFRGGVTTARTVSPVAGRGIGLDIVRATVARLKGEVELRSEPGRGTAIELTVPISMQSLAVLEVEVGGNAVSIPLHAVRRTLRIAESAIARSPSGDAVLDGDLVLPFAPLALLFHWALPVHRQGHAWSAVVVQTVEGLLALGVDRLLGIAEAVLRPMPPLAPAVPLVAGAALDGTGNPQPVLDPAALFGAMQAVRSQGGRPSPPALRPILVVDDSLTTRMLEQSILESAGYTVELATSGEEALEKARLGQYAMIVVDVEMPGMDGFAVIQHLQQDPVLRAVPAMLVTSRNAAEDRRRGEQVGARAYIVKGEFDEGVFLRTIRGLIGRDVP